MSKNKIWIIKIIKSIEHLWIVRKIFLEIFGIKKRISIFWTLFDTFVKWNYFPKKILQFFFVLKVQSLFLVGGQYWGARKESV